MKRADLVWVDPPDQARRPGAVVSPNFLIDVRDKILIAPGTYEETETVAETEVLLERPELPRETKILCQNLITVSKDILIGSIRSMTDEERESFDESVRIVTGLW